MQARKKNFNLKWSEEERGIAIELAQSRGVSVADLVRMLLREERERRAASGT